VLGASYAAKRIFGTWRGIRTLASSSLAAFGILTALIQFAGQLLPNLGPHLYIARWVSLAVCVAYGLNRTYPRVKVSRAFRWPHVTIRVEVGNLFDSKSHIVVGFSDTFDTSTDDGIISPDSVQGQLVARRYAGNHRRLASELHGALDRVTPIANETSQTKRHGNLHRYSVGTVVVVGERHRRVFAVAYSRMSNDLVAGSTVEDLWLSLHNLWDAVYIHGERASVAMPIVGSELARIDGLDRAGLLQVILLSFMAHARARLVCKELRVLVHPRDVEQIDMLAVAAILRSL
jgi:hypothetical protein